MALAPATLLAGLSGLVSLGYVATGLYVARRYSGLGVRGLSTFAVVWGANFLLNSTVIVILTQYGVLSGTQLGSLSVPPLVELFLVSTTPISGLLAVAAIFSWLWFVLTYTTQMDRRDTVGILALGLFVFAVTAVNGLVGALSSFGYISIAPSFEGNLHRFASLVEVLGTGVAVGAGIAQLYRASRRHPPFATEAFLGLAFPVLVPYLARYIYQFGLIVQFRSIELFRSMGLLVGLVGLWVAISRYDVFEQLPASQSVGRRTAFDATDTPIVLLDSEDRVADINPAAGDLFAVSPAEIIGQDVGALFPAGIDEDTVRDRGRTTLEFPASDRVVEVETTATTDDSGREIGRTVVLNDITDERRRQQRIQVLNRVLRHNLRNDLTAAMSYVELLADGQEATEEYTTRVIGLLDGIVDIGDKARDIERMLSAETDVETPTSLAAVVAEVTDDVRTTADDAAIESTIDEDVAVAVEARILRSILRELVENAVVHTDGEVRIWFDAAESAVVVSDSGPGIPDYEIEVLDSEEETDLKHGSGLGLWLVKWGVDRFGGTVRFDADEAGTRATISVPENLVTTGPPAPDAAAD